MKKKIYDLIAFSIAFILLSDIADSKFCYNMGALRVILPIIAAVFGAVPFILFHRSPIDRSWKGIFDVTLDILIFGCAFIALSLLHLWGFVRIDIFGSVNIDGFSFTTTSWMIFFASSLLIRITLITEKLFHWWEKRNAKIKFIE